MLKTSSRPHQIEACRFALKSPYSILALEMGLGKDQPIYSPVYTPTGKKPIGDINVGDFVFGKDGKLKKVLGKYPQGIKDIYKIEFSDGSSTECGIGHLWSVRTAQQKFRGKDFKVKSLDQLIDDLYLGNTTNKKWEIPITMPLEYEEFPLMIPPYTMGVLLGDGSLSAGQVKFTNSDKQIINQVIKDVSPVKTSVRKTKNTFSVNILSSEYRHYFREMGLNVKSLSKWIPAEYKYNSINNRLELLRGLIDTDGYVSKDGTLQFNSSSRALIEDVKELITSLGGVCREGYKKARCQTGIFDSWSLTISLPDFISPATKKFKIKRYRKRVKYPPARYIKSIKKVGKYDTVCISVEGDHYLTDNHIVTHNTHLALKIRDELQCRALVVCPAYLIPTWKQEIQTHCNDDILVSYFDAGKKIYNVWDTDIAVISYELAQKAEFLFEWCDMLILDEGTELKSMDTKRTQFFHRAIFENSIKRVHILTGTPIKNGVSEYYSLISICNYNPEIKESKFLDKYPNSIEFADHFAFRKSFTLEIGDKRVPVVKWEGLRKKHIKELKGHLKDIYIRMKSEDVLDLPPLSHKNIFASEIDDKKLLEEFNSYFEKEGNSGVSPDRKKLASLEKAPFTIKYVERILEEVGCVVVYTDHVDSCIKIAEHFGVVPITGRITKKRRKQLRDEFQAGKFNVIVATFKSFSMGVDLTRSNNIVVNCFPWIPGDTKQALYRILRMNQTRPCVAHWIFGSPQDAYIHKVLQDKQKVIDKIT